MDNGGYEQDSGKTVVEMTGTCANTNGVCSSSGAKGAPRAPPPNPWHRLKTIFLVSILALLLFWLITYILLDANNVW